MYRLFHHFLTSRYKLETGTQLTRPNSSIVRNAYFPMYIFSAFRFYESRKRPSNHSITYMLNAWTGVLNIDRFRNAIGRSEASYPFQDFPIRQNIRIEHDRTNPGTELSRARDQKKNATCYLSFLPCQPFVNCCMRQTPFSGPMFDIFWNPYFEGSPCSHPLLHETSKSPTLCC